MGQYLAELLLGKGYRVIGMVRRSGRVLFDGADLTAMRGEALRQMRRRVQLIFRTRLPP